MKFCLFNDLHLEFKAFDFPDEATYDAMIWAGDIFPIQYWLDDLDYVGKGITKNIPKNKPIYYIAGNHEYYHSVFELTKLKEYLKTNFPNIHFLENDVVVGGDFILYGMTMWTNFDNHNPVKMQMAQSSMNDYRYIYTKIHEDGGKENIIPEEMAKYHDESMRKARAFLEEVKDTELPIVMVTHHSPLRSSHPFSETRTSAYVAQDAIELALDYNIKVWCHGHTHEVRDDMLDSRATRILSNARGYAGYQQVIGFNPNGLIFEV